MTMANKFDEVTMECIIVYDAKDRISFKDGLGREICFADRRWYGAWRQVKRDWAEKLESKLANSFRVCNCGRRAGLAPYLVPPRRSIWSPPPLSSS